MARFGHFYFRCPACGELYAVERPDSSTTQISMLRSGVRCIQDRGRGYLPERAVCGSLLARAVSFSGVRYVEVSDLLAFRVVRDEPRPAVDPRVAELQAEVARLKAKYETPCKGLAPTGNVAEGEPVVGPCGGFMGHPGACAVVW